jgi:hypothetical protein
MCTITPIRIPVRNADDQIIERVDASRARCLLRAPNATAVYARRGAMVGIRLASTADDSRVKAFLGDPRRYTYLDRSEEMPQGVHTLRRLPSSTKDLYRTVRTECIVPMAA